MTPFLGRQAQILLKLFTKINAIVCFRIHFQQRAFTALCVNPYIEPLRRWWASQPPFLQDYLKKQTSSVITVTVQSTNQWLFHKRLMGKSLYWTSVNRSSHRVADGKAGKEGEAREILMVWSWEKQGEMWCCTGCKEVMNWAETLKNCCVWRSGTLYIHEKNSEMHI